MGGMILALPMAPDTNNGLNAGSNRSNPVHIVEVAKIDNVEAGANTRLHFDAEPGTGIRIKPISTVRTRSKGLIYRLPRNNQALSAAAGCGQMGPNPQFQTGPASKIPSSSPMSPAEPYFSVALLPPLRAVHSTGSKGVCCKR